MSLAGAEKENHILVLIIIIFFILFENKQVTLKSTEKIQNFYHRNNNKRIFRFFSAFCSLLTLSLSVVFILFLLCDYSLLYINSFNKMKMKKKIYCINFVALVLFFHDSLMRVRCSFALFIFILFDIF